MVRHHHTGGTELDGAAGIARMEHPLDDDRAAGPRDERAEVVPDEPPARLLRRAVVGVADTGGQRDAAPDRCEATGWRHVDRQDDPPRAGGNRPVDELVGGAGVGERVELEPHREPVDRADLLHRHGAARRHDHRHPGTRRGPGHRQLPVGVNQALARHGGDRHGELHGCPEQHPGGRHGRDVDERAWHEPPPVEGVTVLLAGLAGRTALVDVRDDVGGKVRCGPERHGRRPAAPSRSTAAAATPARRSSIAEADEAATWGVVRRFGAPARGSVAGSGGSVVRTSSAAAPT